MLQRLCTEIYLYCFPVIAKHRYSARNIFAHPRASASQLALRTWVEFPLYLLSEVFLFLIATLDNIATQNVPLYYFNCPWCWFVQRCHGPSSTL